MGAPSRTAEREEVLKLAFEGRWTVAEMAERVSISARTVARWLASAEFKTELATRRANLAESLMGVVYADKASRILGLAQMAESARREYEARPWLVETRPTPNGDITNESFNRDAHAAFRDALNDIAKELGERSSNVNVTATQHNLNVTLVLERMRNDRSIAQQADDFLARITGAASVGD